MIKMVTDYYLLSIKHILIRMTHSIRFKYISYP